MKANTKLILKLMVLFIKDLSIFQLQFSEKQWR